MNSLHSATSQHYKYLRSQLVGTNQTDIGLHSGLGGILLTLPSMVKNHKYLIYSTIEKIFESAEEFHQVNSFCNGISGIGFAVETLVQKQIIKIDTNTIFEDVDKEIYNWMMSEMQIGNYDYMHGSIGGALYLLKRYPSNPLLKIEICEYIELLLAKADYLEDGKIAWKDNKFLNSGHQAVYNLGLSHGIPSILVFLVKAYELGLMKQKLLPVIRGVVNMLLCSKVDFKIFGYNYPTHVIPNTYTENNASRLSWCYGDLGVCCALWHAGTVLGSDTVKQDIIKTLVSRCTDQELGRSDIYDGTFCHGSIGIAHIFMKFYRRYQIQILRTTANKWYQKTLDFAIYKDDKPSYVNYIGEGEFQSNESLLEGTLGIAAGFHDFNSRKKTTWDEAFLIS